MPKTISVLLNLRNLRAQSRELTLEQLQEGLDKLTQVVDERIKVEEQLREENREKEEKLETYRQLLIADGITAEELLEVMGTSKSKKSVRATRPAKYKYTDDDGQEKTWTGQGRTPKFLVNKNLDNYLI